jgi:hypothetical protein
MSLSYKLTGYDWKRWCLPDWKGENFEGYSKYQEHIFLASKFLFPNGKQEFFFVRKWLRKTKQITSYYLRRI